MVGDGQTHLVSAQIWTVWIQDIHQDVRQETHQDIHQDVRQKIRLIRESPIREIPTLQRSSM